MGNHSSRWQGAAAYENYMGRWSRKLAAAFLDWLQPQPGWNWLDVGCGTGALTQAILDRAAPASIVGCDPTAIFIESARSTIVHPAVSFVTAGADDLPQRAGGYDAAAAGLVLNFVPDPAQAVRAIQSRLRPGGTFAAYVWDYGEKMQFVRLFWQVAAELDPRAAELDQGKGCAICRPDALTELLAQAGFGGVESGALEIVTQFADFDDYWNPMLGGTGGAPTYVATLEADAREALRLRMKARLTPGAGGPILLPARAWVVKGVVP